MYAGLTRAKSLTYPGIKKPSLYLRERGVEGIGRVSGCLITGDCSRFWPCICLRFFKSTRYDSDEKAHERNGSVDL